MVAVINRMCLVGLDCLLADRRSEPPPGSDSEVDGARKIEGAL
jgi:hypothetical protein